VSGRSNSRAYSAALAPALQLLQMPSDAQARVHALLRETAALKEELRRCQKRSAGQQDREAAQGQLLSCNRRARVPLAVACWRRPGLA